MRNATGNRRPLERNIQRRSVKYAKDLGWICRKLATVSQNGDPDYQFIKRGIYLEVEFKRPGQKPTELQVERMLVLQTAGVRVMWTDQFENFKWAIDHLEAMWQ